MEQQTEHTSRLPDAAELKRLTAAILLAWTVLVGGLCLVSWRIERENALELARSAVRAAYNKDLVYRRWAAGHGGIYVPITRETPPSPYLAQIPERDIVTPSGRRLTLMNPAYMTRQVHELGKAQYGYRGHITSLKLLRPENAPDPWETAALKAFEQGEKEVSGVALIDGRQHMRLMRPMYLEERCLKCHAHQGYKVGDIRGGISSSVDMTPWLAAVGSNLAYAYLCFGVLWLLGAGGLLAGARVLGKRLAAQQAADREIRLLKNYLANIIDSMPSVLVGMDSEETVTQWNRQAETVTGIAAADALGRPVAQLLPDFSPWIGALRDETAKRRPAALEKLLIERKGERQYYDVVLYPLIANCVEGAVLQIANVTERSRIQEMMVQTEKMMSVGGLAAGMAHEINNPLGMIIQAAQNVERRVSPELAPNCDAAAAAGITMDQLQRYFRERRIPEFIDVIREASSRASRIIANILRFSRSADQTLKPARLDRILDDALELAANDYDLKKRFDFRSIEIVREYDPELPEVAVVAIEIEQVALNLLKNAAQAMHANPPERAPRIVLRLKTEERYAVLEVEDNGPGMEESVERRVFEPFFTTKEPGIGTGLGLSVSYMIVTQNHRGLLSVASSPDNGARFTVRLPRERENGHV